MKMHIKETSFTKRQIFKNNVESYRDNWLIAYDAIENIVGMIAASIKYVTGNNIKYELEVDGSDVIVNMDITVESEDDDDYPNNVYVDDIFKEYVELCGEDYPFLDFNVWGSITKEQAERLRKEFDKFVTRRRQ